MIGSDFYLKLKGILKSGDKIGTKSNYRFNKWMKNGGLQFAINSKQNKTIPSEIIIAAYHVKNRDVEINQKWLEANGHTDWCFPEVLNFIIEKYS